MNWIKDLKNFDREYFLLNPELKDCIEIFPLKALPLRMALIEEEFKELDEAWVRGTQKEFAKELADLIYVCVGTATWLNLDLERIFKEVHNSNMSKFGYDAELRADGKLLKSKSYQPPNLNFIKEEF